MKNLSYRVISAVAAVVILILSIYFAREKAIYFWSLFVVIRGSFEVARMFFTPEYPKFVKRFLVILSTVVFILVTSFKQHYISNFSIIFSFVLISCFGVLLHKLFKNLDQILTFVAKCCLGMVYTCFLPATVVWISQTDNGLIWFFSLLTIVFAGDMGAYIFGVTLGKTKIAPLLSPNKSLQGSLGGLFFSLMAALSFSYWLPEIPLFVLAICGLLGGLLGQIGDFFESLIKRVSGVKDSGSIMPGHGGVLDRLDGVLLSAPLFYLVATYFSA